MNDMEDLAVQAVAVFVTETVKAAAGPIMEWMRRRVGSKTADTAEHLAADPGDGEARNALVRLLRRELEASPNLADELRDLLGAASARHAPQTADVTGDNATVVQIQGDKNRV